MLDRLKYNILEKIRGLDKHTKTDTVYLFSGGFWFGLNQLVNSLSALVLAIILGNFLKPEIYGNYKFIISASSVFLVTSLNWMSAAIIPSIARGFEKTVIRATSTRIRYGFLGTILGLALGSFYWASGNQYLGIGLILMSLFIPFIDSFGLYESYLQGKKLFKAFVLYRSASRIISMCSIIATVLVTDNLWLILLSYFLPITLIRLIFDIFSLIKYPPNDREDINAINIGKHLSFSGALATLATYLDSIITFYLLGPLAVAIYSFALAPIEQIRGFLKFIPAIAVPKFSNKSIGEINVQLKSRALKGIVVGIIFTLIYVALIPLVFRLVLPKYFSSIIFSQSLAVLLVFYLPNLLFNSALNSKFDETPKKWLYWRNLPYIILIICLIILVPKLGLWGVVTSKIIYSIASLLTSAIQWKMLSARQRGLSQVNSSAQ
ncbi:MAG TPA: hypothetical protein P5328_01450 [Candidatus Paceibacterota bacterium]|nr:hypothetical protein [Candidatus Paceibacterota bacterium]HRZ34698.1 hypothetical protein [Candidatus Paceibacterota bacterium]